MPKKIRANPRKSASKNYSYRETAFKLLKRILHHGAYANVVLMKTLTDPCLPPETKRSINALTYGVLRNYLFIDFALHQSAAKKKMKISPDAALAARMAVYEIFFMDKVPSYAAVDEYVKLASRTASRPEISFINACLRKITETDHRKLTEKISSPAERFAVESSHPLWLVEKLIASYGNATAGKIIAINNLPLPLYLRVNTVRAQVDEVLTHLHDAGIEARCTEVPPSCIELAHGESFPTNEYNEGLLTAQDRSTQTVPYFLEPQPGDEILDLCCGAGLKSTHLAELLNDDGMVAACDLSEKKISALRNNAGRLGLNSIRASAADLLSRPDLGKFKKVLLDVPCSGSASLRRRPEIKLRFRPEQITRLADLQYELLCAAADYLLPSGTLLYSTCSLLPEENEHVIHRFLKEHLNFHAQKLVWRPQTSLGVAHPVYLDRSEGIVILPHTINACGVFIAALRKD
ncbi:MAG: 16S rRNA (cytosine(967)-C(5))-methyltransferase RsmB [bacterium]